MIDQFQQNDTSNSYQLNHSISALRVVGRSYQKVNIGSYMSAHVCIKFIERVGNFISFP